MSTSNCNTCINAGGMEAFHHDCAELKARIKASARRPRRQICRECNADLSRWHHTAYDDGTLCPVLQAEVDQAHQEALERHCGYCGWAYVGHEGSWCPLSRAPLGPQTYETWAQEVGLMDIAAPPGWHCSRYFLGWIGYLRAVKFLHGSDLVDAMHLGTNGRTHPADCDALLRYAERRLWIQRLYCEPTDQQRFFEHTADKPLTWFYWGPGEEQP
jgi:hypothetical protein